MPNPSSAFKGVSWCKATNKWIGVIYHEAMSFHLGQSNSEIEIAQRYDKKAIEFGKPLNFPVPMAGTMIPLAKDGSRGGKSQYKGVQFKNGGWIADCYLNGRHNYLGRFNSEKSAACAYDICAEKFNRVLNFPDLTEDERVRIASEGKEQTRAAKSKPSSFLGVFWDASTKKWLHRHPMDNKKISQETFESEIDAAKAYDKVAFEVSFKMNFPQDYDMYANSWTGCAGTLPQPYKGKSKVNPVRKRRRFDPRNIVPEVEIPILSNEKADGIDDGSGMRKKVKSVVVKTAIPTTTLLTEGSNDKHNDNLELSANKLEPKARRLIPKKKKPNKLSGNSKPSRSLDDSVIYVAV